MIDQYLKSIEDFYESLSEYSCNGLVEFSHSEIPDIPFSILFERGKKLEIKFKFYSELKEKDLNVEIISDFKKCSVYGLEVPEDDDLDMAIAGCTGISGCATHSIPKLLLPEKIIGWAITDLENASLYEKDGIDIISGKHPWLDNDYSISVKEKVIQEYSDKASKLIFENIKIRM